MEFFRNNRVKPFDTEVRKPKVVSIPVHFVSSDSTRSAAAWRIQKVLRGFVVRKSMKKIVGIKKEVDEIEMKFVHRETVDLIRKDAKERLKMNEMLMALLFRLDSISGVNNLGVRDCRKSLIKKVIMLQERLDAIVSASDAEVEGKQSLEEEDLQGVGHRDDEITSLTKADNGSIQDSGFQDDCIASDKLVCDGTMEIEKTDLNHGNKENAAEEKEEEKVNEVEGDSIASDNFENCENCGGIENDTMETMETEKGAEEMDVTLEVVTAEAAGEETVDEKNGIMDEKKVLIEKMIEKNEMLIKMVTDLCEKNKLQTEMLNSLSKRVNSLEKKQRCKSKKRRQASKNCFDD